MPASVSGRWFGGKHHGHIHLPGQLRQPFSVTWVGESREMKGVLVGGSGDDRIDFAAEGQPGRGLDGVAGYAACADDPISVASAVAATEAPATDRNAALRRHSADLVLRPNDSDLGIERLRQGTSRNLGSYATRITEGHGQSWPPVLPVVSIRT
jgi:hypothetical protein